MRKKLTLTLFLGLAFQAWASDPATLLQQDPAKFQASEQSLSVARSFAHLLEREAVDEIYAGLDILAKKGNTPVDMATALRQLHSFYGKPTVGRIMGSTRGVMSIDEQTGVVAIPIESVMFKATFEKPDGSKQPGLLRITFRVADTSDERPVLKFIYIPASNIEYEGSYKIPKKESGNGS